MPARRFFTACLCESTLPRKICVEDADYVVDGQPVCNFNCYVRFTAGPESDWDFPPLRSEEFGVHAA